MPDIIESPVIKIVFNDHLRIWNLVLGAMTGGGFEGDENVVSISVAEVAGITLFFTVLILLMILLTNFFYLVLCDISFFGCYL